MTARLFGTLLGLIVLATVIAAVPDGGLPDCAPGQGASTRAPDGPPPADLAGTCRAHPTSVQRVDGAVPSPGYHHLGATTVNGWSGVLGRIEVRDPGVPAGGYDFVAVRFLATSVTADGIAWIEAGWTETGWAGGRQRIYAYDTDRDAWTFFDQYDIADGDRIWIHLQARQTGGGYRWLAWLWWGDTWHLLADEVTGLGERARVEQYVEVHTDARRPPATLALPAVTVDGVRLRDGSAGGLRPWRDDVATHPGGDGTGYCVDWLTRYDTWRAGTCPAPRRGRGTVS